MRDEKSMVLDVDNDVENALSILFRIVERFSIGFTGNNRPLVDTKA